MGRRGPLSAGATGNPGEKLGPVPPPPAWLGEIAKREYTRIRDEKPDLTAADAGLLASYAQAYGEVAEHTRRLDGDPAAGIEAEGYTVRGDRGCVLNPRVRALNSARVGLLAAAQALGLTPISRIRSGPAGGEAEDGASRFEEEHGAGPA